MKQIFTLIIFSFILFSCKKEISQAGSDRFLQKIKISLKDSMNESDYAALDFSKAILNKVDSVNLYLLRIPVTGKSVDSDFVIVKTGKDGKMEAGKIIHLQGKANGFGEGKIQRRAFDGNISISSLDRKGNLNSTIENGYITAFHSNINSRAQLMEANVMPEVVVVAYVHYDTGIDFSTWFYLQSLLYDNGGGGGGSNGGYYGSDGGGYNYGGGGSYGGSTGDTGSGYGANVDQTMLVDVDTYVNNPAIDINQYLKCFDNIPDDGATCSITICSDIPVDTDPSKLFNWNTESPGHCFLELKKSNGAQSVQQSIGFYPIANWKNILSADPVDSKMVDDGHHEFNASLKMDVTPFNFRSAIGKMKELSTMKYDMDEFNCTDFALEVFNYIRNPLEIPQYVIPGGLYGTKTPQGLYNKLNEMWRNNDPETKNITIDILKAYVGGSSRPCN